MAIIKKEELKPVYDSRKSFYKKAWIKYADNGDIILQSYSTDIAVLHSNGEFEFEKYSYTSNRHLYEFMKQFDIDLKLYNTK